MDALRSQRTASEIWVCLQVRDEVSLINDGSTRRVDEHSIWLHHLQCGFVNHACSSLVEYGVEADNVCGFQNRFDRVKLSAGNLLAAILGVHAGNMPRVYTQHDRVSIWHSAELRGRFTQSGRARAGPSRTAHARRKIIEEVLKLLILVQVVVYDVHVVPGRDHPSEHGANSARADDPQSAAPQPLAEEEVRQPSLVVSALSEDLAFGQAPGSTEHQRAGHLSGRLSQHAGCVADSNAALGGFWDLHVVVAHRVVGVDLRYVCQSIDCGARG